MRPVALLALVLSLVVSSGVLVSSASAQAADPQLQSVRELIQQARFADAVSGAQTFLERTNLEAAERNAGLEALAIGQFASRQQREAEETLRLLYSRDPGHRLTDADASPPVIGAFARARESEPEPVVVQIVHETPVLRRREPPTMEVRIEGGADAVAEVRLVYRIAGESASSVVMSRRSAGVYAARIPVVGDASVATDVAYHVVALAPSLTPLALAGTEAEPLQVRIPAAEATSAGRVASAGVAPATPSAPADSGGSVAEEWWFWTIIGLVVVGGAVTLGVLLGPGQETAEPGTLGVARLMQVRF